MIDRIDSNPTAGEWMAVAAPGRSGDQEQGISNRPDDVDADVEEEEEEDEDDELEDEDDDELDEDEDDELEEDEESDDSVTT